MDTTEKENRLETNEPRNGEQGNPTNIFERTRNEDDGENSNETWATVVSKKKEGKGGGQEKEGDLQSNASIESEKNIEGQRNALSQKQQMLNKLKKQARYQREYKKEATLTMMVRDIENSIINNIIKVVEDKVGIGKLLGPRRKNNNEFELTMESDKKCEILINGLMINGEECEVKKLCATEKMVSFLNLPSYIHDDEIQQKLSNWGVTDM